MHNVAEQNGTTQTLTSDPWAQCGAPASQRRRVCLVNDSDKDCMLPKIVLFQKKKKDDDDMNNANLLCTVKIWITVSDNQAHSGTQWRVAFLIQRSELILFYQPDSPTTTTSTFLPNPSTWKCLLCRTFQYRVVTCLGRNIARQNKIIITSGVWEVITPKQLNCRNGFSFDPWR